MRKLTKLERFKDKVLSRYDVYNNVFLTLPFESINDTGRLLPLFSKHCSDGFKKNLSPLTIVDGFFNEYLFVTSNNLNSLKNNFSIFLKQDDKIVEKNISFSKNKA